MQILRTPESRFDTVDFFEPDYTEVGVPRMAYVDEGPADGATVLMLHGEPSWSYLYRKMIPVFVEAGYRAVAPDLIGFGRSDKPTSRSDYTFRSHLTWIRAFVENLQLREIILVCQDWGGLLGLRMVAADPDRFRCVVAANTFLPTGNEPMSREFLQWQEASQRKDDLNISKVIQSGTVTELDDATRAAYDAPFPDKTYKAGALEFPVLVPTSPTDPASKDNMAAWERLATFERPFLTIFGDSDPITGPGAKILQSVIPGAKDQPHQILENAGHFIQEDRGEDLARAIVTWL